MAYSGPIPTFQVSSNSIVNNVVGGLVNNAAGAAVNIALSTALGQKVTSFLGLGVAEAPGNIVSSILTPGLISTGSQALTDVLTTSILKSKALGPAGPLVAGLATSVVQGLTNQLIQGLTPPPKDTGNKYFPGAGEEEDANYGGSVYNSGQNGADVVFSIKPAQNTASAQAQEEVTGDASGGVPESMGFNEQFNTDIAGYNPNSGELLSSDMSSLLSSPNITGTEFSKNIDFQSTFDISSANQTSFFSPPAGTATTSVGTSRVKMARNQSSPSNSGRVSTTAGSSSYSPAAQAIGAQTSSTFVSSTPEPSGGSTIGLEAFSSDPSSPGNLALAADVMTNPATASGGGGGFGVGQGANAAYGGFGVGQGLATGESDTLTPMTGAGTDGGFAVGQASGEEIAAKQALEGWKFTTTPADINWELAAKVERAQIFGSNKPPVISGSRGMRDLSLSNALIEGFTFNKSVESKIARLESLLDYNLTNTYVKVPVYWVTASDKKYGDGNGEGGYFVIKQIKVKEELRDLSGKSTRAVVDISFTQVPNYQVDDGRDLASKQVAGGKSILASVSDQVDKFQKEQLAKAQAQPAANPASAASAQAAAAATGSMAIGAAAAATPAQP